MALDFDVAALDGALDASAALRALLHELDMPQRRFAIWAGVSVGAVSRWCSRGAADRIAPPRSIVALAATLRALDAGQRAALGEALDRLEAADGDEPSALRRGSRGPSS